MQSKKNLKVEICEKTSSALCAIFVIWCWYKLAFERWSDFRLEKNYFSIPAKTKVVSVIFRLK